MVALLKTYDDSEISFFFTNVPFISITSRTFGSELNIFIIKIVFSKKKKKKGETVRLKMSANGRCS